MRIIAGQERRPRRTAVRALAIRPRKACSPGREAIDVRTLDGNDPQERIVFAEAGVEVRREVGESVKAGDTLAVIEASQSLAKYPVKTLIDLSSICTGIETMISRSGFSRI